MSRWSHVASLAAPAAIDGAAHKLAERCRSLACASSLVVAVDRDAVAKDLVEVAGAARRAGFERVLFMRVTGGTPPGEAAADTSPGVGCEPPSGGDAP